MKNYVKISCSVLFKRGLNVSVGRTAEDILATCDSQSFTALNLSTLSVVSQPAQNTLSIDL